MVLDKLEDDSEFKKAAERGGRWPDWKQMLAEQVNEAYRLRSGFQAVHSKDGEAGFDTRDFEFVDPVVHEARRQAAAAMADAEQQRQDRFDAELGNFS